MAYVCSSLHGFDHDRVSGVFLSPLVPVLFSFFCPWLDNIYSLFQLDARVTTGFLCWVVASYSLGQLVAAPLLGMWSNLRGKALEPIVVSLALKIPANILYMYLETIPSGAKYCMIVARALVGIGSGTFMYNPRMHLQKYLLNVTCLV